MIVLKKAMALAEGTRVAVDGKVIMADGTYRTLLEGQALLVENRRPTSI